MKLSRTLYLLVLLLTLCFALPQHATAQNTRIKDYNSNGWYMYFGDHRLSDKWGFHTEAQLRRYNVLSDPQQLLLRTGINYYLPNSAMLTLGYAYADTHPYGEYPAAAVFPEHRIYQQLQLKGKLSRLDLTHRYRQEQRWVQPAGTNDYTYTNRTRYMLRAVLPLIGTTVDAKEPYLAAYDEVFVNFGKNVQRNVFDQNRLYAALGYKFSNSTSLELGYLSQILQKGNGLVFEHNHTLQAALYINLDLRKREL